jgi:phosphomannomutase
MKIVKSGSRPLEDVEDFQKIKALAVSQEWIGPAQTGQLRNIAVKARQSYADKVLSFVDVANLRRLKLVINSGNGAAGPTVDKIIERLKARGAPVEFVRVHHEP